MDDMQGLREQGASATRYGTSVSIALLSATMESEFRAEQ